MKTTYVWEAVQGMMLAALALYAHALATHLKPAWLFAKTSDQADSKAPFKFR